MSETGSDWLSRLRSEGERGFVDFIRRWAPRFERMLGHHGFPPADAYDLSYSCATQVLVKLDSYPGDAEGFEPWVWAVARNFAEDWRRRNLRAIFTPLDPSMTAPPDAPEEPDGPSERVEAVMEGLKKLAPDDRKLITMRHLNGSATFKEIAQELGISEGAARVRHHRILLDLKRLLEQDPRIQSLL